MPRNLGIKPSGIEDQSDFPRTPGSSTVRTVRETWQVLGDFPGQDAAAIKATPGIPQPGDLRGVMGLKSLSAREADALACLWDVEAEWDSRAEGQTQDDDPLRWRPIPEWTFEELPVQIQFDQVNGKLIATAAGEKFLDVTTPIPVAVRTLTRFEPFDALDYYDAFLLEWAFCANSEAFRGWPPYTVKLAGVNIREEVIDKIRYSRVSYVTKYLPLVEARQVTWSDGTLPDDDSWLADTFDVRVIGWRASLLHQGLKYVEDASANPKVIKTYKDPVTNQRGLTNLRANGEKLGDGEQPVYIQFHPLRAKDLNLLNI